MICTLPVIGQLQDTAKQSSEAQSALAALKETHSDLSSHQPRLERQLQLLTKEVHSLKQVLKMYEDEAPKPASSTGSPAALHLILSVSKASPS